jgi:hypothetical protein
MGNKQTVNGRWWQWKILGDSPRSTSLSDDDWHRELGLLLLDAQEKIDDLLW